MEEILVTVFGVSKVLLGEEDLVKKEYDIDRSIGTWIETIEEIRSLGNGYFRPIREETNFRTSVWKG